MTDRKVDANDEQVIRKAVELADGWSTRPHNVELTIESLHGYAGTWRDQELQDALAAQLVRQVDALESYAVYVYNDVTEVVELVEASYGGGAHMVAIPTQGNPSHVRGPDRTMNTLRAIVESKVLEDFRTTVSISVYICDRCKTEFM